MPIIKITGYLNGVSYYLVNGKQRQRIPNPPTKEQIYNDPRFASVRANNKEFGGASTLAKAIGMGLGANVKYFKDPRFTSRLTGALRHLIQRGSGSPGHREANLYNHPEALIGFQLHKKKVFNQIFTADLKLEIKQDSPTLIIPKITPSHLCHYPKSATHFKLTAALVPVSPYRWQAKAQKYQPLYPSENALGVTAETPPLLCGENHINTTLHLPNPIKAETNPDTALTIWLGISFGKMKTHQFEPFQTARAMECIAIL